jgi:environmental stress-induced protein Ves
VSSLLRRGPGSPGILDAVTTTTTTWRNLRRTAELPSRPWVNGRGSTVELISADESALFQRRDFPVDGRWRLSLASLTTTGPFSRMPGTDRIHTPAADIELTVAGAPHRIPAHTPFSFDGGATVELTGLSSATSAVNLMVDRDSPAAGRLGVEVVAAGEPVGNALVAVLLDGTSDVLVPWRDGMGDVRRTDGAGRMLVVTWRS